MKNILLFLILFFPIVVSAQTIAAGRNHSLNLCNKNNVWAWGYNWGGQLGNGTSGSWTDSDVPVPVSFLNGISDVAGGVYHSFALKNDGTVWAWGYNIWGQLGNGTNTDSNFPVPVNSLSGIITIAGNGQHNLALKNDGTVWAWGYNIEGELGNGSNANSNVPVPVSSISGIRAIAEGVYHSLALHKGTVWAWGSNAAGQLGNGNQVNSNTPVHVNSLSCVNAIAGGYDYSLALKNNGTVWTWGSSGIVPTQVDSLTNITAIAAGWWHSLALRNDSTVWAWGQNYSGQLGNGTNTTSTLPMQVLSLTGIIAIAAGEDHSLALKNDGKLWAWGNNSEGQLGNGAGFGNVSYVPVQVIGTCQLTTTVNEIEEQKFISVYPNPSSGIFIVNLENKNADTKLCIHDLLGNCVLDKLPKKNSNQEIDLTNQRRGIYFLEIVSDGERVVKKIVLE